MTTKKSRFSAALLLVSLVAVIVFALAASKPNFARCGQRVSVFIVSDRYCRRCEYCGKSDGGDEWRYQ
jgi:hypothetical protein